MNELMNLFQTDHVQSCTNRQYCLSSVVHPLIPSLKYKQQYIGFGGLIDGCSALGVVYDVSLEVVMTTRA